LRHGIGPLASKAVIVLAGATDREIARQVLPAGTQDRMEGLCDNEGGS
jgi:hypothetical protein